MRVEEALQQEFDEFVRRTGLTEVARCAATVAALHGVLILLNPGIVSASRAAWWMGSAGESFLVHSSGAALTGRLVLSVVHHVIRG